MQKIIKYTLIYIIMIITFFTSLYLASAIPQSTIERNIKLSTEILKKEGIRQKVGAKSVMIDNWSDAVMLNTAYSIDSNNILQSIIYGRRSYDPNRKLEEIKENKDENPIDDLEQTLSKTNTSYYKYARYWHGYLVFLRPLLTIFNYVGLRVIFCIIVIILAAILVYYLNKNGGKGIALIFGLVFLMFSYQYVGLSIQYVAVTVIFMAFSIYIAKHKKAKAEYFFIVGGLTSFFDLLTTPLLTLRNTIVDIISC